MRRLLGALTVRGKSFVAAGLAAAFCGLIIPEPDLVRIGCLLMALPLLSAFGAGRYLARPAPNADSSGSAISRQPIRTRSGSGMIRPQKAAARPAATNDFPRTVSAPSSLRT